MTWRPHTRPFFNVLCCFLETSTSFSGAPPVPFTLTMKSSAGGVKLFAHLVVLYDVRYLSLIYCFPHATTPARAHAINHVSKKLQRNQFTAYPKILIIKLQLRSLKIYCTLRSVWLVIW